jgi:hypothetical protein
MQGDTTPDTLRATTVGAFGVGQGVTRENESADGEFLGSVGIFAGSRACDSLRVSPLKIHLTDCSKISVITEMKSHIWWFQSIVVPTM